MLLLTGLWCHPSVCGNTILGPNRPVDPSLCSMPCPDTTNNYTCGAAGLINLYVRDNLPVTRGPASVVQSYNCYSIAGCWL